MLVASNKFFIPQKTAPQALYFALQKCYRACPSSVARLLLVCCSSVARLLPVCPSVALSCSFICVSWPQVHAQMFADLKMCSHKRAMNVGWFLPYFLLKWCIHTAVHCITFRPSATKRSLSPYVCTCSINIECRSMDRRGRPTEEPNFMTN